LLKKINDSNALISLIFKDNLNEIHKRWTNILSQ